MRTAWTQPKMQSGVPTRGDARAGLRARRLDCEWEEAVCEGGGAWAARGRERENVVLSRAPPWLRRQGLRRRCARRGAAAVRLTLRQRRCDLDGGDCDLLRQDGSGGRVGRNVTRCSCCSRDGGETQPLSERGVSQRVGDHVAIVE